MRVDAYAKLGPAGRRQLVLLIEEGMSLRAAAAASSVSPCGSPMTVIRTGVGLTRIHSAGNAGDVSVALGHRCSFGSLVLA